MEHIYIIIEVLVIGYFIFQQLKTGRELKNSIQQFTRFIPSRDYFKTESVSVSTDELRSADLHAILQPNEEDEEDWSAPKGRVAITLINPKTSSGTAFDRIIESLNIYLLKNNGGIADFNIVKDLVERNVSVEEEEIKETINKPLYLGLMATIIGIIFGLFTMLMKLSSSDDTATSGLVKQLDLNDFLIAVCIAMVASFLGLFITSFIGLNSFKTAKRTVEQHKNGFYNFVQTDLLPVVSQDFGSSVAKLTNTMNVFNTDFTANIHTLNSLFQKNYETLKVQDTVLGRLEQLNANDFVQMNAKVLLRLEKATNNFDKFNGFIESLNSRLGETRALSDSIAALLNRVNNFESIAHKIDDRIEDTNTIITFLKEQFSTLDTMSARYKGMLLRVDDNLDETLKIFENNVISNREGLTNLINEQHELLEKAYTENVTKFDLLDNLKVLPEIKQGFDSHQAVMFEKQLDKVDHVVQLGVDIQQNKEQIVDVSKSLKDINTRVSYALDRKEEMSKLNAMHQLINRLKEEVEKSNRGFFKRLFTKN